MTSDIDVLIEIQGEILRCRAVARQPADAGRANLLLEILDELESCARDADQMLLATVCESPTEYRALGRRYFHSIILTFTTDIVMAPRAPPRSSANERKSSHSINETAHFTFVSALATKVLGSPPHPSVDFTEHERFIGAAAANYPCLPPTYRTSTSTPE